MSDDEIEVPPLSPGQNVGMALVHSQKATGFLQAAVQQDAVVIPRKAVEKVINGAREIGSGNLVFDEMKDEADGIVETLSEYT